VVVFLRLRDTNACDDLLSLCAYETILGMLRSEFVFARDFVYESL